MEFKKYIIFESKDRLSLYLNILNRNLKVAGLIKEKETWDRPRVVGSGDHTSKRFWLNSPREEFQSYAPTSFIEETTDTYPIDLQENIYKIYCFVNEDADKKVLNYLVKPNSLEYKKDVNIRFAQEEEFDQYGNLIKVVYYEYETVDINPLGIKTVNYFNKILEATFVYTYEADGYLNYRDATRAWYKMDETIDAHITKRKFYNTNQAKKAGERRRKNVQNIMEQKVGTSLFSIGFFTNF